MRYVVLGAGAVGGAIAGRLALAGHDVGVLARGAHAAAIRADGLHLQLPGRTERVALSVATTPAELVLGPDDVLVLATKTQDSLAVLTAVAELPVAGRSERAAAVLAVCCAQNGVTNERLALRRFAHVYGVCVMLPAVHLNPGQVSATALPYTGILDIGRYPDGLDDAAHAIAGDWESAGFLAVPRPTVMAWKYAKLLRNLANAVQALCGPAPHGEEAVASATLARTAKAEGERALAAAGIDVIDDETWNARRGHQVEVPGGEHGGSSWQSATRGSPSIEADYLNGEIVLLGRLHGVSTPVNTVLQRAANSLVAEHRPAGSVPASTLLAQVAG